MVIGERSFWAASLSVAYVCAAAWQSTGAGLGGGERTGWVAGSWVWGPWALVALPLLIFGVWRYSAAERVRDEAGTPVLDTCLRAAAWGAILWFAARLAPAGRPGFEAIANLGVATTTVAACVALAKMRGLGGMLRPQPASQSLDAAVFVTLIWGVAIAVPLSRFLAPSPGVWLDPLAVDYATTAAAVASVLVLIASSWRARHYRKLELGLADRAAGALALATTAFATAVPAAAANLAAPDRILPLAALFAALAVIATARAKQAASIARVLRITIAVMVLGVPTALLAAALANAYPQHGALLVLVGSLCCIAVGLAAQVVARPLGPDRSRWLAALESASRGALEPEPNAALVATLRALDKSNPDSSARCQIWQRHPEQSLTINIAGYLQIAAAPAPPRLYELGMQEPLCTLRTPVLEAMQVRRPEVRPLLAWLQARNALCITLILEEDEPIGFLLVPRGRRRAVMTLEEVEALHLLTQRISALLAVSSALARSREREMLATRDAQALQAGNDEHARNQRDRLLVDRALARTLARPVRTACYSAAARLTASRIQSAVRQGRPLRLTAPAGVDVRAWGAWAHLERGGGPLIVLDASTGLEAETQWSDPEHAPWRLARGGTLLITGFQSLSDAARDALAAALLEGTSPATDEGGDAAQTAAPLLIVADGTAASSDEEVWLDRRFRRPCAVIALPSLAERAEDLRPMVLDLLARLGPGLQGEPLGIEPAALRALLEHSWPGNDAELTGVVTGAVARCKGPRISVDDLVELATAPARSLQVVNDPSSAELSFAATSRRRHSPRK